MTEPLYGDGVHDDGPGIQAMLDSGVCEVALPAPKTCYMIGKTLLIHSGQTLRLPRFAVIMLMDGANCAMLENADFDAENRSICVEGGIWDMNHSKQWPNPGHMPGADGKTLFDRWKEANFDPKTAKSLLKEGYTGLCMRFCRIDGFILKDITFKNPVTYAVQMAHITHFTVRDILFDYTEGSPKKWNMDGIHLEGGCKHGLLTNLQGACHDDTVAITSADGLYGPIADIVVDGIHAERSHSAVRLLSADGVPIENVHIRNIYGTFYVYCVGITVYDRKKARGVMKNISIENVAAAMCEGTEDVPWHYAFLWVEEKLDISDLRLTNICRVEREIDKPFLFAQKDTVIDGLVLDNLKQINESGKDVPFLDIGCTVRGMVQRNCTEITRKPE